MKVSPIEAKAEVSATYKLLRSRLVNDASPFRRTIGFPSGNEEGLVYFIKPIEW